MAAWVDVATRVGFVVLVVWLLLLNARLRRKLDVAQDACARGHRLLVAARAEIARLRDRSSYLSS